MTEKEILEQILDQLKELNKSISDGRVPQYLEELKGDMNTLTNEFIEFRSNLIP